MIFNITHTMKRNLFFIILIALAAFVIAGVGAWFSVYGLTKIFPAGLLTFILFGSLEFAKIVVVSFVYRFWKITKFFQRAYLILATIVLMAITSAGIYGFLTNSYQSTSNNLEIVNRRIALLETKRDRYQAEYIEYAKEKERLNETVNELSKGLSNNTIQYIDKATGQLITTTSSATRKALESQLDDAKNRRTQIYDKSEVLSDSVTSYDLQILELKADDTSSEIGPLKYIAKLTNSPMDKVVNWLSMLIIFVFDPLAIILIISLNQLMVFSGFDPFATTKSYKKLTEKEEHLTTSTTIQEPFRTTIPDYIKYRNKPVQEITKYTTTIEPTTTTTTTIQIVEQNLTTTETPRLNNIVEKSTKTEHAKNSDNLISRGQNFEHTKVNLNRPHDP